MSRYRPNSRRRKNKRKRKLTPLEKQEIVTLREMGHTYKEIATRTQFSYATVEYTCTKSKMDPDVVKKARADALERAARETMERATLALAAITPDSVRHDMIEVKDDAGKLVAVKHFGQSALQNATTFGILADKAVKFSDRASELRGGTQAPLTPTNIQQLLGNLGERVRRISQTTTIDFGLDELEARIDTLKQQATDADFEELEE